MSRQILVNAVINPYKVAFVAFLGIYVLLTQYDSKESFHKHLVLAFNMMMEVLIWFRDQYKLEQSEEFGIGRIAVTLGNHDATRKSLPSLSRK
jgi:hypothetical protein